MSQTNSEIKLTDAAICEMLNQPNPDPALIPLAVNSDNIYFDNRSGRFAVDQSVCGCPLKCLDWNTHETVSGKREFIY